MNLAPRIGLCQYVSSGVQRATEVLMSRDFSIVPNEAHVGKLLKISAVKGKFACSIDGFGRIKEDLSIDPIDLRNFCGRVMADKALVDTINQIAEKHEIILDYNGQKTHGGIENRDELVAALRKEAKQVRAVKPKPGQACVCGEDYEKGDLLLQKYSIVVGCPKCATEERETDEKFLEVGDDAEFADETLKLLSPERKHLVSWHEKLFAYSSDEGVWREVDRMRFESMAMRFRGSWAGDKPLKISKGALSSVMHCAKVLTYDSEFRKAPRKGIAFRDKFVSLEDGKLVVSDHSPDNEAIGGHSFSYDPTAQCPYWLSLLESMWGKTEKDEALPDFAERCAFVQTFAGLSLLGYGAALKKIMFLIGPGGNGKSTIIYAIEMLHCRGDTLNFPLSHFAQHFGKADIFGKKFVYDSETSTRATDFSQGAKLAARGEIITASVKGKEDVRGKPDAAYAYAQNEFPELYDDTDGWFDTLVIIDSKRKFARQHSGGVALESIISKLESEEKMGMINWALEGAVRFFKEGGIKIPSSSQTLVEGWKKTATSGRAFIDQCCYETENWNLTPSVFYPAYEAWLKASGRSGKLNADHFTASMEKAGYLKKEGGCALTNLGLYARADWGGATPPPDDTDNFMAPTWWNGIANE
jgi:P4 family phage/plasmid primase-like protien